MIRGFGTARDYLAEVIGLADTMFQWQRRLGAIGDEDQRVLGELAAEIAQREDRIAARIAATEPLTRARHRMWVELSNDLMAGHYKIAIAKTPSDRTVAIAGAREALQRFEQVVVGPWFAGDALGIVDFAAGPALVRFERLGIELGIDLYEGLPKVAAWSKRISERPAFKDSLIADFDERFHALIAAA